MSYVASVQCSSRSVFETHQSDTGATLPLIRNLIPFYKIAGSVDFRSDCADTHDDLELHGTHVFKSSEKSQMTTVRAYIHPSSK